MVGANSDPRMSDKELFAFVTSLDPLAGLLQLDNELRMWKQS